MNGRLVSGSQDSTGGEFALGISQRASGSDAPGNTPAIDLVSLLPRCLNDPTFCGMILHKFAARAVDQMSALQRALDTGNMLELAREAHTVQGVAANLSAVVLRSHAAMLEAAAREHDLAKARRAMEKTHCEIQRCTELVPELLAKLGV